MIRRSTVGDQTRSGGGPDAAADCQVRVDETGSHSGGGELLPIAGWMGDAGSLESATRSAVLRMLLLKLPLPTAEAVESGGASEAAGPLSGGGNAGGEATVADAFMGSRDGEPAAALSLGEPNSFCRACGRGNARTDHDMLDARDGQ